MSAAIRALVAALLVAVVALAGALYIGYRNGLNAGQSRYDASSALASLDLRLVGPHLMENQLVGLAFRQVERVYYKPVDANTLVKGERDGLLTYLQAALKSKHVHATLPAIGDSDSQSSGIGTLDKQLAYARDHYGRLLGKDGTTDLTQAALSGMLGSLRDPYTEYLSPQQIAQLNESLSGGNFGGIGVYIQALKDGEIILEPIEGMPAQRAGMHDIEVVQQIDGHSIGGMSIDTVERLIRGPEGSTVTLTTHPYHKQTRHHYSIVRQVIHVPTVYAKMEGPYDYIRLSDFGETSADEVRKAILSGKAHHAKGYILDLRDNGGGLLEAAVNISSFFVPKGVLVTEIDRFGNRDPQYATGNVIAGDTPLVILVNGYTASASEITSGALQDYKLATLIGTKTFGKGVVQGIFSMPNGGALKITTERYITPAGRDIHHKGIEPDIVVAQSPDMANFDTPRDKQLQAAKEFLAHPKR